VEKVVSSLENENDWDNLSVDKKRAPLVLVSEKLLRCNTGVKDEQD